MLDDLARCLVMVGALLVDLQSLLHLLGAIGCLVAGKALGQLLPHLFEELLKDLDGLRDFVMLLGPSRIIHACDRCLDQLELFGNHPQLGTKAVELFVLLRQNLVGVAHHLLLVRTAATSGAAGLALELQAQLIPLLQIAGIGLHFFDRIGGVRLRKSFRDFVKIASHTLVFGVFLNGSLVAESLLSFRQHGFEDFVLFEISRTVDLDAGEFKYFRPWLACMVLHIYIYVKACL